MSFELFNGDCLEVMKTLKPKSVDLILTDLPYGVTDLEWDIIIPFDKMWSEFNRVLKDCGTIALTATNPFASSLINSNLDMFKYEWVWIKNKPTGFVFSKTQPLRNVEYILVFQKHKYQYDSNLEMRNYFQAVKSFIDKTQKQINTDMGNRFAEHCFYIKSKQFNLPDEKTYNKLTDMYNLKNMVGYKSFEELNSYKHKYNPQGLQKIEKQTKIKKSKKDWIYSTDSLINKEYIVEYENYPNQVLYFDMPNTKYHPTQKPVELMEYIIKTYTNENDIVLDCCMGSGSTGVAALNCNRRFIGIEKEYNYFEIANKRLKDVNNIF